MRREAIRSSPECAASERIPKLPVLNPTTTLRAVITTAARTELPAAERFSARINSDEGMAGFPDMKELSPLREESAKQIAARVWSSLDRKDAARPLISKTPERGRTVDYARI